MFLDGKRTHVSNIYAGDDLLKKRHTADGTQALIYFGGMMKSVFVVTLQRASLLLRAFRALFFFVLVVCVEMGFGVAVEGGSAGGAVAFLQPTDSFWRFFVLAGRGRGRETCLEINGEMLR